MGGGGGGGGVGQFAIYAVAAGNVAQQPIGADG